MSSSVDGETVSTVRVGVAITVEEFKLKTSPGFTSTWASSCDQSFQGCGLDLLFCLVEGLPAAPDVNNRPFNLGGRSTCMPLHNHEILPPFFL